MKKILSALLLTLAFAVPAFAQMHGEEMMEHKGHHECGHEECAQCGPGKEGHHGMHDMMGMCLKHAAEIGLTQDQVAKIKGIHREMEKREARFEADKKIAKIDMMGIMEVKDFDLEKASAQVQKISDIERDHHLEMVKSMKEVRSILTDEQFKKMEELKHHMMDGKMCEMGKGKAGMPHTEKMKEHHHEK